MLLQMYADVHFRRALMDGFFSICDNVTESLDDIMSCGDLKDKIIRLQVSPRKITQTFIQDLPMDIQLHPKNFDHVLYVYKLRGRYFWGISPRDLHMTTRPEYKEDEDTRHTNRAYFKIKEVMEVMELEFDRSSSVCLDIGAAPGGWAEYTSTKFASVVCIDPAELHPDIEKLENVTHIKKKLEDSIEELMEIKKLQTTRWVRFLCL
eukprot:TRINITY_DN2319_c0_g1_i1.p1 TRINITY_DN2319_c0_g1~~TRINITY_DN2319_c0_g1_i1.p1  ORF type:complete len:207 (+),score=30.20 TRINITY_DN2319_c0_g1_i1:273-893(+)